MPIKGLTDHASTDAQRAFPVLGILRPGDEKPNQKQPGKNLPGFRFTSESYPELVTAFYEYYGKQPSAIPGVQFLDLPVDQIFDTHMRAHHGNNTLKIKCDGVHQLKYWTKTGYSSEPRPCENTSGDWKCPLGCRPRGLLYFMLPDFLDTLGQYADQITQPGQAHNVTRLGVFLLKTGGVTMANIASHLRAVHGTVGTLSGMRFTLRKEKAAFTQPGKDGAPTRYENYIVQIEVDASDFQRMYQARPLLPDADVLDDGDEQLEGIPDRHQLPAHAGGTGEQHSHWTDDPEAVAKFEQAVAGLGLDIENALDALANAQDEPVLDLSQLRLSKREAWETVKAAARQRNQEAYDVFMHVWSVEAVSKPDGGIVWQYTGIPPGEENEYVVLCDHTRVLFTNAGIDSDDSWRVPGFIVQFDPPLEATFTVTDGHRYQTVNLKPYDGTLIIPE